MNRWLGVLLCLGLMTSAAAHDRLQIQYAEAVDVGASIGGTSFEAYGRRFDLSLESNERLLKALQGARKAGMRVQVPLRGKLRDAPGSWVRLARVGNGLEGAIWDGRELYVVTRYESIAAHLTLPLDVSGSQTVLYRLSDTLHGLPANFCGLDESAPNLARTGKDERTGLERYKDVVSELRAGAALGQPTDQLEIALVADTAFQNLHGADADEAMLAQLNTVDGIFAEQVGVIVMPTHLRLVPANADPFTSSNPQTLLEQFADYRAAQSAVREPGLAHLMTGKDLEGDTIGIAFLDALCDPHDGVSLSEGNWGSFLSALIMAHELGHNFGARHDGVPGGFCESTPQFYLMAPTLNSSTQFSQCSLDAMAPVIARARGVCLHEAVYADVAVSLPASPFNVDTSATFSLPVTVRSAGNVTAEDVSVEVVLSSQLTFESAVLTDGSCAANGNTVTCTFGDLPAGEERVIELRLRGNVLGTFNVQARARATNDFLAGNDTASVLVGLQSAVDLGVTLAAAPADPLYVGDLLEFAFDLSSLRSQAAVGGTFNVQLGTIPIESFEAGSHACTLVDFNSSMLTCQLADVPSGTSTRIVVRGRPVWAGFTYVSASVSIPGDGEFGNNYVSTEANVRAEWQVITQASTENLRAVIGAEYDITFTLTAAGRLSSNGVVFNAELPRGYGEIVAATPSRGACAMSADETQFPLRCEIGDLEPDDVASVVVRLRMDVAISTLLVGRSAYSNGAAEASSYSHVWITSNLLIDVAVDGFNASFVSEGQTGDGNFGFQSIGVDPAQNVVVTLDMPAPVRLTQIQLSYAPTGWTCALESPQRARCAGSFHSDVSGTYGRAFFDFVSDVPVETQGVVSLTADLDGNPENDTATFPIQVRTYLDASVVTNANSLVFDVGQSHAVDARVRTAHNPVPGVWFHATQTNPIVELESITVDGADCPLIEDPDRPWFGAGCFIGDLPGNSDLPVSVRYRALEAFRSGQIELITRTERDSNPNNDIVFVNYQTQALTNLHLALAGTAISAVRGSRVRFPLITVTNGNALARNVQVTIALSGFVSVDSVSSSGLCSGVIVLSCLWNDVPAGGSVTVDLQLRGASPGTFTSTVTLRADNDANVADNNASVAVTVTAPASGGGPGGGGSSGGGAGGGKKGGGGGFEWVMLAALGLLLTRRTGAWRVLSSYPGRTRMIASNFPIRRRLCNGEGGIP